MHPFLALSCHPPSVTITIRSAHGPVPGDGCETMAKTQVSVSDPDSPLV
jgi:hypothetical protein